MGLVRTSGATGPDRHNDDVSGADGAVGAGELHSGQRRQAGIVHGDLAGLGIHRDRSGLAGALGHCAVAASTEANGRRTSNPVVGVGRDKEPRRDVSGVRHGWYQATLRLGICTILSMSGNDATRSPKLVPATGWAEIPLSFRN